MRNFKQLPFLACLLLPGYLADASGGRGTDLPEIRVMSYNVENLWDAAPDNTERNWQGFLKKQGRQSSSRLQYDGFSFGKSNYPTPEVLARKVRNILKVIDHAGQPEIIAVQELESANNQSEVLDIHHGGKTFSEHLHERGYTYLQIGKQDPKNPVSVTTGIFSKLPFDNEPSVEINFSQLSPSARDVQVVSFDIGGDRLMIFNGHWKSKSGDGTLERVQTARAVKKRVAAERRKNQQLKVIVLGDLNSAHYEEPMVALGTTGYEGDMLGRSTSKLYNLWYELPESQRWEHSYNGERNTLSHILVSDSLYTRQGLHYVDQSFQVLGHSGTGADFLIGSDGRPFRWQIESYYSFTRHIGEGYSDHLPLLMTLTTTDGDNSRKSMHSGKLDIPTSGAPGPLAAPARPLLDEVPVCAADEIIDLDRRNYHEIPNLIGQCVRLEFDEPLPLKVRGKYRSLYAPLHGSRTVHLGIVMTRSWDPRPNLDDSRIRLEEVLETPESWDPDGHHPRSNRCFQREVLQGYGGKLVRAVGRIGYDGFLAVFVPSREPEWLVLTDLPEHKRRACNW